MADSKISDLAAVTDVVGTDEYVLARAGANKKIDASDLLQADNVSFTPGGTVAATDVQAAIAEVASESYHPGGTDVALDDGGTGASLSDPGADRILFWDDSAGQVTWLTPGTNLTITDTTIAAAGGGGGGMTVISDTTLVSDTATFDLTSIPGSYTHLRIMLLARATASSTAQNPQVIFNNDSGSNYDYQNTVYNTGGTAAEGLGVAFIRIGSIPAANSPANVFGTSVIDVPFYLSSVHKTLQFTQQLKIDTGTGNTFTDVGSGLWRSTSAITRITFALNSGDYVTGSRLILYGTI